MTNEPGRPDNPLIRSDADIIEEKLAELVPLAVANELDDVQIDPTTLDKRNKRIEQLLDAIAETGGMELIDEADRRVRAALLQATNYASGAPYRYEDTRSFPELVEEALRDLAAAGLVELVPDSVPTEE